MCLCIFVSSCNFAKSFAAIDSNYAARTMAGKAVQKQHMLRQDVEETTANTHTDTLTNTHTIIYITNTKSNCPTGEPTGAQVRCQAAL